MLKARGSLTHLTKFSPLALRKCHSYAESRSVGRVELLIGPMFSGKTEALIQTTRETEALGAHVTVVKSIKDTRYGTLHNGTGVVESEVVTHGGQRYACVASETLQDFRESLSCEEWEKLDVVCIDEGQFFQDLLSFCRDAADRDRKHIVVAGLSGDFLRSPFGQILDLIPHADSIKLLKAKCEICGKDASFTKRTVCVQDQELIGGADVYRPVCREHYS